MPIPSLTVWLKNDLSVCSNCNSVLLFIYLFRQTDLEIFRVTVFPRQPKNENQPFTMHLGIRPASPVMTTADSPRQPRLVNLKSMALSKLIFSRKEVWEDLHGRADGSNIHLSNHLYLQERVKNVYTYVNVRYVNPGTWLGHAYTSMQQFSMYIAVRLHGEVLQSNVWEPLAEYCSPMCVNQLRIYRVFDIWKKRIRFLYFTNAAIGGTTLDWPLIDTH